MSEQLRVDVTIIGGGIAGCAAAVALRQAGLAVAVLEKNLCGAGASGVNFGGVRQQGRDLAELPLARRARPLWDALAERLGEAVEFQATGHLKLANGAWRRNPYRARGGALGHGQDHHVRPRRGLLPLSQESVSADGGGNTRSRSARL